MDKNLHYEVETRVYFESYEEALDKAVFLKDCLKREVDWTTYMFGPELYKSGRLLRMSRVEGKNHRKFWLGYKDKDIGKLYNVRAELDENITGGVQCSEVLKASCGGDYPVSPENVFELLEKLGHKQFMAFSGKNFVGEFEGFSLKLMNCEVLKHKWLLEIEMGSADVDGAHSKEKELKSFADRWKMQDRIVMEEPPALLFEAIYS